MKTCVILNPAAGSVDDVDSLRQQLSPLNPASFQITGDTGSAERAANEAIQQGCELIVAAGGDGTLNEVVNGIATAKGQAILALLPLGTGNDFARVLGAPAKVEEVIRQIQDGHTIAVDLVRVRSEQERYFINVSCGGFSGLVDEKMTPEMKKSWGPLAYLRCAAAAFPEMKAYQTSVTFDDDQPLEYELCNVIVANGRFVAGGIPVAPEADISDGLLDVVLIPKRETADLALLAAQIALGKHLSAESVTFRRAKKVEINSEPGMWFNVDGEVIGNDPAVFEVMPHALRCIAPRP